MLELPVSVKIADLPRESTEGTGISHMLGDSGKSLFASFSMNGEAPSYPNDGKSSPIFEGLMLLFENRGKSCS